VIIPTIGRPDSLRRLLGSLGRCDPQAAEIVIVDQSGGGKVAAVVEEFAAIGARRVTTERRSVGHARNVGLRAAQHEIALITDDDCAVAENWVGEGCRLAGEYREHLITGTVLPGEESEMAVSTKVDPEPHDYTGEIVCHVLYSGNMVAGRSDLLAFGGFDARLPTASDNDLCFRWLRAGRPLRYEPSLRVWHHDTRTPDQLRRRYREYWRGQGAFYGKHIRRRDRHALRFLRANVRFYTRRTIGRIVKRSEVPPDFHGFVQGLVPGLVRGLFFRGGPDGDAR
jgi:GT2 family glycosyltransferase